MSELLSIGVIGKSFKENENRVAIHPEQIVRIPEEYRRKLTFEEGYGERFGYDDKVIAELSSGRIATRQQIFNDFDCVLMPKPLTEDLRQVKEGRIVWGWPHCVQQRDVTQIAIDRKLTLIAWEEMFTWSRKGEKSVHTFYKNNEIAGYAGVNHALSLIGLTGNYGKQQKVGIFGYGAVSRGAIYALQGQGYNDITVYTVFSSTFVKTRLPSIKYKYLKTIDGKLYAVDPSGSKVYLTDELSGTSIIVNGILQNTEKPLMFIDNAASDSLLKGSLIIDISCDEGMGFWCAKPTTFEDPIFKDNGIYYYSVDHSPSYYWNSASWEISEAIIPYIPVVMGGPEKWEESDTIYRSIEIMNGIIHNPRILSFQNRRQDYPHKPI